MSSGSMNEKEYRSSAWALLIVGGIGLLLVVLGMTGVLPLQLDNPYLFYGVMMSVFILFIVMGAVSFRSARFFAEKTKADKTLMETVEGWCLENLKAEDIDIGQDLAMTEEVEDLESDGTTEILDDPEKTISQEKYFVRVEYMKQRINSQFMNLDQDLLDRYVDERLYDLIFGDKVS